MVSWVLTSNTQLCNHYCSHYWTTVLNIISIPLFCFASSANPVMCMCVCMLGHFNHVQLFATLWTARLLCPWDSPGKVTRVGCHASSRGSSWPSDQIWIWATCVFCIAGGFCNHWATGEAQIYVYAFFACSLQWSRFLWSFYPFIHFFSLGYIPYYIFSWSCIYSPLGILWFNLYFCNF